MPVRAFTEDDIPQVADLYWNVLRERTGSSPVELQTHVYELYFKNPWINASFPSLVSESKDKVTGFLGVVPRKMSLGGQPLLTAFGGNFAVHPEFRTSLAGVHLLRAYISGGQDISLTDSANDISRALLERLGFTTIMAFSLHWIRVLRPARFATFALSRIVDNPFVDSLAFAARPLSAAVDGLIGKLSFSPFRPGQSSLDGSELDVPALLACQQRFRNQYSLWPEHDAQSLTWILSFMIRTKGHGRELRKVILRDQAEKIVGWYIYTATPGGMGEVVQLGGERQNMKHVLDHLLRDAWSSDVIALRGIVDRDWMPDLSEKNCFFTCRGGWMVAHSRKPECLKLLSQGDAYFSRLDGEWCLALGA